MSGHHRPRLLLDFDGVLHTYTGWNGGQLESPLTKARHACMLLAEQFELVCFTARANSPEGQALVEAWLARWGFPIKRVTAMKEAAVLCVDDRAICFEGEWNDTLLARIRAFHPYWEPRAAVLEEHNNESG